MEAAFVRINEIVRLDIVWSIAAFLEQGMPFRNCMVGINLCIKIWWTTENYVVCRVQILNTTLCSYDLLSGMSIWSESNFGENNLIKSISVVLFNTNMSFCQYRNSMSRPTDFHNGKPYNAKKVKMASLYWSGCGVSVFYVGRQVLVCKPVLSSC